MIQLCECWIVNAFILTFKFTGNEFCSHPFFSLSHESIINVSLCNCSKLPRKDCEKPSNSIGVFVNSVVKTLLIDETFSRCVTRVSTNKYSLGKGGVCTLDETSTRRVRLERKALTGLSFCQTSCKAGSSRFTTPSLPSASRFLWGGGTKGDKSRPLVTPLSVDNRHNRHVLPGRQADPGCPVQWRRVVASEYHRLQRTIASYALVFFIPRRDVPSFDLPRFTTPVNPTLGTY